MKNLLKTINCSCGMTHSCEIKDIIIKPGAIYEIRNIINSYKKILLVADNNTYAVCGDAVNNIISDRLETLYVYETDGFLVPDEKAVEILSQNVTNETDLIIGVGSGVIQDLCKYVSFRNKLPYFIIATAPSMDGYASKGAAMITENMKVTYNTHVPEVIIGDTDILKNAPIDMIKSGYGDILGKFSCLNDWKLAHLVNGEYFCDYVYNLIYEILNKVKDLGPRLLRRDSEAVGILTEALIGVGIAMAYVGNSRPASGSEHHLSHFFEIVGLVKNEPYFMHGIDVAYSAVYTQKLREELMQIEIPSITRKFVRSEWENIIHDIYGNAANGVIELQDKIGWYEKDKISTYIEKWNEIKDILSEVPSSAKFIQYLESAGFDMAEFDNMYGKDKIRNGLLYAKDLKDRYTVLWMYYLIS